MVTRTSFSTRRRKKLGAFSPQSRQWTIIVAGALTWVPSLVATIVRSIGRFVPCSASIPCNSSWLRPTGLRSSQEPCGGEDNLAAPDRLELAAEALRLEDDLGVARALQDLLMHLVIAPGDAGLGARGVEHKPAAGLVGVRI